MICNTSADVGPQTLLWATRPSPNMEDHQFLPNAEMADGVVNPIGMQDPQKFSWAHPITPVEPVAVPSLNREDLDVTST